MEDNFGAYKYEWDTCVDYIGTRDLIPIVSDPNVPIAPNSKMKGIGKTPSVISTYGYAMGLKGWTELEATDTDVTHWKTIKQYGIGIHCRYIKALDIDIEDFYTVIDLLSIINSQIALPGTKLPFRSRENTSRILIPFKSNVDFGKITIADKNDESNKVEILSTGNQFVAYGTHTSGARYVWSQPDWPVAIPLLDSAAIENLVKVIHEYLGGKITRANTPKTRAVGESTYDNSTLLADPIFKALNDKGMVFSEREPGIFDIECPFDSQHSKGEPGDSSTQYFASGTNGYSESKIHCLHTHGNAMEMYAEKLGVLDDYIHATKLIGLEKLPDEPQEHTGVDISSKFHDDNTYGVITQDTCTKWLIQEVIAEKSLSMMYGPPSVGKSFLIMDIAYSIAVGEPFADRHRCDKRGKVLYVAAEGADGIRKRINVIRKTRDLGIGPDSTGYIKIFAGNIDLVNKDIVNKFIKLVKQVMADDPPVCIIFDTLAANMVGDENNSKDGAKVINNCNAIINRLDTSIILVHHTGKNAELGARGWSGFKGAISSELVVSAHEDGVRSLHITKNKDGASGGEYAFKLDNVSTGVQVLKYKRIVNADGSLGVIERDADGNPVEIMVNEESMVVNWRGVELPINKTERTSKQHSMDLATVIDVMRDGRFSKSMREIADLVQGKHPDISTAKVKGAIGELITLGRVKSNGAGISDATYSLVEEFSEVGDMDGLEEF